MKIKTGMTSVTFRKKSAEDVIAIVKEAGLDGIEWGGDIHVPAGDLGTCLLYTSKFLLFPVKRRRRLLQSGAGEARSVVGNLNAEKLRGGSERNLDFLLRIADRV